MTTPLAIGHDARKFLDGLPAKQCKQVTMRMLELTQTPRPHDSKAMSGHPGTFAVGIGEFRICYAPTPEMIRVVVIGKRGDNEVYRDLKRLV